MYVAAYPRQDSENGSLFSQAVAGPCPILAALCFLKQLVHFLIATPGRARRKKRGQTAFGATLSAGDGILRRRMSRTVVLLSLRLWKHSESSHGSSVKPDEAAEKINVDAFYSMMGVGSLRFLRSGSVSVVWDVKHDGFVRANYVSSVIDTESGGDRTTLLRPLRGYVACAGPG